MEGGSFSKWGSRLGAADIRLKSLQQLQATGMEGGLFSKWGSHLGAADTRLKHFQQLQGWRAVPFQNAALGRLLFKGARSGVKKMFV